MALFQCVFFWLLFRSPLAFIFNSLCKQKVCLGVTTTEIKINTEVCSKYTEARNVPNKCISANHLSWRVIVTKMNVCECLGHQTRIYKRARRENTFCQKKVLQHTKNVDDEITISFSFKYQMRAD